MQSDAQTDIVVEGFSDAADPLVALIAALVAAAQALGRSGATASDVTGMTWSTRVPAAIHPHNWAVDLAFREQFGGIRPPIALRQADTGGVRVVVAARKPGPAGAADVWGGFSRAELARQYSTRAPVRDMPALFDAWRADGAAFRAAHLTVELPYGRHAGETLDLYMPTAAPGPRPLWIFIHGGFWQAVDKAHQGQFAAGMLAAGYAVAVPNYTLAPAATVHDIVRQMQQAVRYLFGEAPRLGLDPTSFHVAGHSAGGHLAAMLAALPEGQMIRSCLPLSGLFDLAPLAALPMGPMIGLYTAADVALLSPHTLRPQSHVRVGVAIGGDETGEFKRQSVDFARAWGDAPCRIFSGKHHFDLLDGLKGGELLAFAKVIAGKT